MGQSKERSERLAELNDAMRVNPALGRLMITHGVDAEGPEFVGDALAAVAAFDDFNENNDPFGEHDFGRFTVRGQKLYWKFCYYDTDLRCHSHDPCDPTVTVRVLTVMLAHEY